MEGVPISATNFPPGIRFHPSDQELISYYLQRKVKSLPLPPNVITDIDLYTYDPWDLPRTTMFGDEEWYFFTPRVRKYPNGDRPNRAAASGYWKATGTDQPIRCLFGSRMIGVKKGLVFYKGKPPNGHRMDWIMTEYRLPNTSRPSTSMRLDDWVLCRIRQKGNMSKNEILDTRIRRKNFPSAKDSLSGYLQSNEYKLIVSLLRGHNPSTFFHSESSAPMEQILPSDMTMNEHNDFTFQSGLMVATNDARSYIHHVFEGNKCKPSNACISLQEVNTLPAFQETLCNTTMLNFAEFG